MNRKYKIWKKTLDEKIAAVADLVTGSYENKIQESTNFYKQSLQKLKNDFNGMEVVVNTKIASIEGLITHPIIPDTRDIWEKNKLE